MDLPEPKRGNLTIVTTHLLCTYLEGSQETDYRGIYPDILCTGVLNKDLGPLELGQLYRFLISANEISVTGKPDIRFKLIVPRLRFQKVKEHLLQQGKDPRVHVSHFLINQTLGDVIKCPDQIEHEFPNSVFESQFIQPFGPFSANTSYNFKISSDSCLIIYRPGTKQMICKYAIIPGELMLVDISGPPKL